MRFLHLGDLHIGKSLKGFSLIDDQKYLLKRVIVAMVEKKVDVLVIAGDIYDRGVPSEAAVELFNWFLQEIAAKKIPLLLISGNHDSEERLAFGQQFFSRSGIYINTMYKGKIQKVTFEDAYGPVNFYLLPYVKAATIKAWHPQADIKSYEDAVRTAIENSVVNSQERNVILSHQFVTGSSEPVIAGSDTAALNVGTLERISSNVYDVFDYVALGHIHSSQMVGRPEVRYSGSLLKYSYSELGREKEFPIVTLEKKGMVSVELLKISPLREMRKLTGKLSDLVSAEDKDTDAYVYAELLDENPVPDAMSILQTVYPYAVELWYKNERNDVRGEELTMEDVEEKKFSELMDEFFLKMKGRKLSKEEWQLLNAVKVEAGVYE